MTRAESPPDGLPQVPLTIVPDTWRWNVIDVLTGNANRGIELGVAAGSFSRRMVQSGRFRHFWGVDSYGDGHDIAQYKKALHHIGIEAPYTLLRMTFAQAVDLFPDRFFDFIYIDGYAHTGEEGGQTMIDWYAKLRPGGIMAGDDYSPDRWPLVVWGVNHLVRQLGVTLQLTDQTLDANFNRFPSWFFVKPAQDPATPLHPDPDLVALARASAALHAADDQKARRRARRRARQAADADTARGKHP